MNLVEQIFEQAKGGSAQGESFYSAFAQGAQQAQRQQQLDMQKQQLAMEIAQAPLKQTLLQQDSDLKVLAVQNGLQQRQNYINATSAFTNLSDQVTANLEDGSLNEAVLAFTKGGLSNNVLLTDPRYVALGKQLDLMQREADLAEYRKGVVEARTSSFTPTVTTVTDPTTGKKYPVVQTGPHQSQVLDPEKDALTRKAQELRAAELQQHLPETAKAELRSTYKQIDRLQESLDALPEMSGMIWNRQPNPKRIELQKRIDALKEKAASLARPAAPAAAPASATPPTAPSSLRLGSVVVQGGKRYIYQGGDPKDPSSYVEAR